MVRLALALAVLAVGCSSSSNSLTCCFDINGDTTFWVCPDQASYTQCCNPDTPINCGADSSPPNSCTQTTGTTCSVD